MSIRVLLSNHPGALLDIDIKTGTKDDPWKEFGKGQVHLSAEASFTCCVVSSVRGIRKKILNKLEELAQPSYCRLNRFTRENGKERLARHPHEAFVLF